MRSSPDTSLGVALMTSRMTKRGRVQALMTSRMTKQGRGQGRGASRDAARNAVMEHRERGKVGLFPPGAITHTLYTERAGVIPRLAESKLSSGYNNNQWLTLDLT